MANESIGLLGRKLGMTQIYDDAGNVNAVTVIDASDTRVLAVKTEDGPDGYNGVVLGNGTRKASQLNRPMSGNFEKAGVTPRQHLREVRLSAADLARYEVGTELKAGDFFAVGDKIDVIGTSKGRGFAGVMKRHNFRGFERSHGVHEYFRHGGSIGTRLTPGMVLKGKKMGGQMGNARVTVQNLRVAKIDDEKNLVYVLGGVPGANGSIVTIRKAIKG